jgi:hypothetical protein
MRGGLLHGSKRALEFKGLAVPDCTYCTLPFLSQFTFACSLLVVLALSTFFYCRAEGLK